MIEQCVHGRARSSFKAADGREVPVGHGHLAESAGFGVSIGSGLDFMVGDYPAKMRDAHGLWPTVLIKYQAEVAGRLGLQVLQSEARVERGSERPYNLVHQIVADGADGSAFVRYPQLWMMQPYQIREVPWERLTLKALRALEPAAPLEMRSLSEVLAFFGMDVQAFELLLTSLYEDVKSPDVFTVVSVDDAKQRYDHYVRLLLVYIYMFLPFSMRKLVGFESWMTGRTSSDICEIFFASNRSLRVGEGRCLVDLGERTSVDATPGFVVHACQVAHRGELLNAQDAERMGGAYLELVRPLIRRALDPAACVDVMNEVNARFEIFDNTPLGSSSSHAGDLAGLSGLFEMRNEGTVRAPWAEIPSLAQAMHEQMGHAGEAVFIRAFETRAAGDQGGAEAREAVLGMLDGERFGMPISRAALGVLVGRMNSWQVPAGSVPAIVNAAEACDYDLPEAFWRDSTARVRAACSAGELDLESATQLLGVANDLFAQSGSEGLVAALTDAVCQAYGEHGAQTDDILTLADSICDYPSQSHSCVAASAIRALEVSGESTTDVIDAALTLAGVLPASREIAQALVDLSTRLISRGVARGDLGAYARIDAYCETVRDWRQLEGDLVLVALDAYRRSPEGGRQDVRGVICLARDLEHTPEIERFLRSWTEDLAVGGSLSLSQLVALEAQVRDKWGEECLAELLRRVPVEEADTPLLCSRLFGEWLDEPVPTVFEQGFERLREVGDAVDLSTAQVARALEATREGLVSLDREDISWLIGSSRFDMHDAKRFAQDASLLVREAVACANAQPTMPFDLSELVLARMREAVGKHAVSPELIGGWVAVESSGQLVSHTKGSPFECGLRLKLLTLLIEHSAVQNGSCQDEYLIWLLGLPAVVGVDASAGSEEPDAGAACDRLAHVAFAKADEVLSGDCVVRRLADVLGAILAHGRIGEDGVAPWSVRADKARMCSSAIQSLADGASETASLKAMDALFIDGAPLAWDEAVRATAREKAAQILQGKTPRVLVRILLGSGDERVLSSAFLLGLVADLLAEQLSSMREDTFCTRLFGSEAMAWDSQDDWLASLARIEVDRGRELISWGMDAAANMRAAVRLLEQISGARTNAPRELFLGLLALARSLGSAIPERDMLVQAASNSLGAVLGSGDRTLGFLSQTEMPQREPFCLELLRGVGELGDAGLEIATADCLEREAELSPNVEVELARLFPLPDAQDEMNLLAILSTGFGRRLDNARRTWRSEGAYGNPYDLVAHLGDGGIGYAVIDHYMFGCARDEGLARAKALSECFLMACGWDRRPQRRRFATAADAGASRTGRRRGLVRWFARACMAAVARRRDDMAGYLCDLWRLCLVRDSVLVEGVCANLSGVSQKEDAARAACSMLRESLLTTACLEALKGTVEDAQGLNDADICQFMALGRYDKMRTQTVGDGASIELYGSYVAVLTKALALSVMECALSNDDEGVGALFAGQLWDGPMDRASLFHWWSSRFDDLEIEDERLADRAEQIGFQEMCHTYVCTLRDVGATTQAWRRRQLGFLPRGWRDGSMMTRYGSRVLLQAQGRKEVPLSVLTVLILMQASLIDWNTGYSPSVSKMVLKECSQGNDAQACREIAALLPSAEGLCCQLVHGYVQEHIDDPAHWWTDEEKNQVAFVVSIGGGGVAMRASMGAVRSGQNSTRDYHSNRVAELFLSRARRLPDMEQVTKWAMEQRR